MELSRDLERMQREKETLAGQRAALESARLAAEDEVRRIEAFERAFAAEESARERAAKSFSREALDESGSSRGFRAAFGKLLFPVVGRSDVLPGHREGATGPGLEIRAMEGTPVRAVYEGRVTFADRYGTYGRVVIVDHGDHYFSVYGNLGSSDVRVGEELPAGARVGTVGNDGKRAYLYLEIRHGTETTTPGPWLGVQ